MSDPYIWYDDMTGDTYTSAAVQDGTAPEGIRPLYTQQSLDAAILKVHDAAIERAIQRLNSDTYNLTKAECVDVLRSLKGQP